MFFTRHKTTLLEPEDVLAGRETPLPVPERHDVLGTPIIALLIAVIVAIFTFGRGAGMAREDITKSLESSLPPIAALSSPERDNILTDVESLRGGRGTDSCRAGNSPGERLFGGGNVACLQQGADLLFEGLPDVAQLEPREQQVLQHVLVEHVGDLRRRRGLRRLVKT